MAAAIIIICSFLVMIFPLLLWFLRSLGVIHTNWRPSHLFNKILKFSWICMPIGFGMLFLVILTI